MTFEEFEQKIWEKGFGIVAMNHYTLSGTRRTYCVILGNDRKTAFQAEGEHSQEVFDSLYHKVLEI